MTPPDPAEYYDREGYSCWDVVVATANDPVDVVRGILLGYVWRLGRKPGNDVRVELSKIIGWAGRLDQHLGGEQ